MKSIIFTVVVALFAISNLFSQSSSISVFTQDGEKFWLIVNGEKKNTEPLTKVNVSNLTGQNYKIKVIFQDDKIPAIDKTIYTKDVDNNYHNSTYVIRKDNKGRLVIKGNSDEIVTTTTTTTTTTTGGNNAQNNTNTQTYNQTTTTTTTGNNQQNIDLGMGVNVHETENGVDMNVNMGGVNINTSASGYENGMNSSTNINAGTNNVNTNTTTSTTTTTTTTTSSSTGNVSNTQKPLNNTQKPINTNQHEQKPVYVLPGYSGPVGCPMPMSPESFTTAKQSISSKSFEDSKLTIAKQIINNNCLLCSQVKDIMMLFGFEDTRLEFAKMAYKHTFDIGNYYQLNDAFKFESSIDDLNQYINEGK